MRCEGDAPVLAVATLLLGILAGSRPGDPRRLKEEESVLAGPGILGRDTLRPLLRVGRAEPPRGVRCESVVADAACVLLR
jgi:hypothetical protein